MGKKDRIRRPARRRPFKDIKPLILVVTEGEVTEPQYLAAFARWCTNPRVEVVVESGAGVPKTIVDTAKRLKQEAEKRADGEQDDHLRYDEVWCVFDVDDHPGLDDARQTAGSNGLRLAVSNPSIELWLLLHFRDQPGMQYRDKIKTLLKSYVPGYNKHVDFRLYQPHYQDAEDRARRLEEICINDGEEGRNPSTSFWRLTSRIRQ